jgi:translation elongation factor EF-Tu-like GTPase
MFAMTVEGAFVIKGRGTVAAGILLSGRPIAGETVILEAEGRPPLKAFLSGVEMGPRPPKTGILLRDVAPDDVPIGATIRSAER